MLYSTLPRFFSNNAANTSPNNISCSVVDNNGNIYTSLAGSPVSGYGCIQKTTILGISTIFLQLTSSNTGGNQFPSGLALNSAKNQLYYTVRPSNNIYLITTFSNPSPTLYNTIGYTGTIPSGPIRIINYNTSGDLFISAENSPYNVSKYVKSTNTFSVSFDLDSFGSGSYGIALDTNNTYMYIGLVDGRILKGTMQSGAVSLFITLPFTEPVYGLLFISNNLLLANYTTGTPAGSGYIINISTLETTLFYNSTNLSQIVRGSPGLGSIPPFLYAVSSNNFMYNLTYANYKTPNGTFITDIFAPYTGGQKASLTNYTYWSPTSNAYLDINNLFDPYDSSGSGPLTKYTVNNGNYPPNTDLNIIFKQKGGVPIIQPITTWCYKTATITWTNTDTPDYYILNQIGNPNDTYNNITTLSYSTTNLINGTSYTFTVTAVYSGGIQKTSSPLNYSQPATSTYFTGYNSSTNNGSNTTLTFTTNGTLIYNCPTVINNASALLVGGGGGGGGGYSASSPVPSAGSGGGGGGGEAYIVSPITISTTISVIIGNGGTAGAFGANGGPGTLSSIVTGTSTYSANPGQGGIKGNNGSAGGAGGGSNTTAGGNGGNGGNGVATGDNGQNSAYYNSTFLQYSGGGGGGVAYLPFGGSGGDGVGGGGGGTGTGSQTIDGSPGVSYGGGGGGQGAMPNTSGGAGGAGRQGIVIFTIPN
jgi:hypothetical protein